MSESGQCCTTPINKVHNKLYIGDHNAASNHKILNSYGITHIINCAIEIPNYYEDKYNYLRLDLEDSDDSIIRSMRRAYRFIEKAQGNVLVHCHMGKSRSASTVIYWLMKNKQMTYENALKYLKRARPIVNPNMYYEKQLKEIKEF